MLKAAPPLGSYHPSFPPSTQFHKSIAVSPFPFPIMIYLKSPGGVSKPFHQTCLHFAVSNSQSTMKLILKITCNEFNNSSRNTEQPHY